MTRQTPILMRSVGEYLATLGSAHPAPGGGSVAGLVGALAAGLGQMVVSLTMKGGANNPDLAGAQNQLNEVAGKLLAASEADELAYSGYLDAARLPQATDAGKSTRREAMQVALINAAEVPLAMATTACELLDSLEPVVAHGSTHALSDAEIAVSLAHASVQTALVNVRVNVSLIKDVAIAAGLTDRANDVEERARAQSGVLHATLEDRRG